MRSSAKRGPLNHGKYQTSPAGGSVAMQRQVWSYVKGKMEEFHLDVYDAAGNYLYHVTFNVRRLRK